MHKAIIYFFIIPILCLFGRANASAASDEFNKYCNAPKDATSVIVCSVSRELNASPLKVGAAMVIASLEMTSTFCNFSFTQKFIDSRIKFLTDIETARVVKFLIEKYRGSPPPGYSGDPKVFCKMQYETFGPNARDRIFK